MSKLKIDDIVDVVVSTAARATPRDGYNIGLILGKSGHVTVADRCKVYTDTDGMLSDGFTVNDPEYKAATLYFSQNPAPQKLVVGACNTAEGSTETWVEALTACNQANGTWYAAYVAAATALSTADHQAIAAYLEGAGKAYFYDDKAAADLTNVATDVFSVLKGQSYHHPVGLYSTTLFAGAAVMGFAMGANDGTAGSAYTLFGKSLVGVTPDDLGPTEVEILKSKNANYYVTRGGTYTMLENGVTADGTWFDEVIGLDQLANDMQMGCMDVITGTRTKVPYTDAGALQFVSACNDACDGARDRGFLAPGVWDKPSILELETGDTLEEGYFCQAEPVADQSDANRSNRICPPIYAAVHLAGAIHSAVVKVIVE